MSPTVAATNVIGEFEEDIKGYGSVTWGQRVNGTDPLLVGVSRAAKAQAAGGGGSVTTAQRIMQANGIKAPKRPPPVVVPPPPHAPTPGPYPAGPHAAAAAAAAKQRAPKLADVIEELQPPGCCRAFFGSRAAAPSARPGPANDSGHLPPPAARGLTVSASGRGAPSVVTSSFRQANQSIKRVPQSARSRGASARSARGNSASRSEATAISNWDDSSDGEFEELEDFIDEDTTSLHADNSSVSVREEASPVSTGAGGSRTPSRAMSNAIIAYAASNKAIPKSILKSAKRDSIVGAHAADAMQAVELVGRSRVVLTDGDDEPHSPQYNPMYGGSTVPAISTYGPSAPPGFASSSIGASGFRVGPQSPQLPAVAGSVDGSSAACGAGDWQHMAGATQNGGGGGAAGAGLRTGPPSLKLTAEELLGLLMAQGKLTEYDVQELGLSPGPDLKGCPGHPGGSPVSHSTSKFVPGSGGSGSPTANSQGSGTSQTKPSAVEAVPGWPPSIPPSLAQLRGNENNTSLQRVRFGSQQVAGTSGGGGGSRELVPALVSSGSHRVRFGGDDLAAEVVRTGAPVAEESESGKQHLHSDLHNHHQGQHMPQPPPGPNPYRQPSAVLEGSLGLEGVLTNTDVLRLDNDQPRAVLIRGLTTREAAAAVSAAAAGVAAQRANAEALRLGPAPQVPPPSAAAAAAAGQHRPAYLRSSDSGVLTAAGSLAYAAAAATSSSNNAAAGGTADVAARSPLAATLLPARHTCCGHPEAVAAGGGGPAVVRGGQPLRISTTGPVVISSVAAPLILADLSSRPGSAGSNNSIPSYNHWAPSAVTAAASAGANATASATAAVGAGRTPNASLGELSFIGGGGGVRSAEGAAKGTFGRSGASAVAATAAAAAAAGNCMGAVDRLALRKLQSHMNKGGAARNGSASSDASGARSRPQRVASKSNWIHDGDGSSGSADRDGAEGRPGGGEQLLSRTSVGRSVRFTAPVVFELHHEMDDEEEERGAVAAAAAAAERSRAHRGHNASGGGGGNDVSGDDLCGDSFFSIVGSGGGGGDGRDSSKGGAWT